MMKMMILAPRRAGMSHGEFRRYVTQIHGPLVRCVPEVACDIRHYHYNFPVHDAADAAFGHPLAEHLDIVTQGWFDSRAAQLANMAKPQYLEIVRPDEHRFAGPGAVMHYTFEARVSDADVSVPGEKIFYFRRRRAGLSREEFQVEWRTRFFEAFSANRELPGVAQKYIQNHVLSKAEHPDGENTRFFDVIDEIWLRTPRALHTLRDDFDLQIGLRKFAQIRIAPVHN